MGEQDHENIDIAVEILLLSSTEAKIYTFPVWTQHLAISTSGLVWSHCIYISFVGLLDIENIRLTVGIALLYYLVIHVCNERDYCDVQLSTVATSVIRFKLYRHAAELTKNI